MATGGQEIPEPSMESIIEGLEKPCNLRDTKEKISSLKDVDPETKKFCEEKISEMIEEKEHLEQKLAALAEALYKNAREAVPEELKTVLKEIRDALSEIPAEESDKDTGKTETRQPMATPPSIRERPVVWALEMGDTYTSYAFSLDVSGDLRIGINYPEFLSKKTSTAILIDGERNVKFFGYEAEEEYASMVEAEEEKYFYYFKSFSTVLRSCLNLRPNLSITEETGKSLEAQLVFALSIKYFVKKLFEKLESESKQTTMADVNFVITIPASSEDTVSQFLTDAAKAAGIEKDQVLIVPEPVAASLYCQRVDSYNTEKECFRPAAEEKYLLVDLGGESSKFTVQVKAENDELDRVISVTFSPWGGNSVNEDFFRIFEDALGDDLLDLLKRKHADTYIRLWRQFEIAKRTFTSKSLKMKIGFPQQLDNICSTEYNRSVHEIFSDSEYGEMISVLGQNIIMERKPFLELFQPTLYALKEYIKEVLEKNENKCIRSILLVGGFAESELVREVIVGHIKKEYPNHRVFIPKEPELAILKGAVFCGRLPYTLRGKVHQYTFGIQFWPKFNPDKHPPEKKVMVGGIARCKGSFSKFAQKGNRIKVGDKCTKLFLALEPDANSLMCEIYASDKTNPQFTSECILQGTIEIKLPKTKPENLIIEENFQFLENEMHVTARDIYLTPYKVDCSYQMTIKE